jgi:hypothetical protein
MSPSLDAPDFCKALEPSTRLFPNRDSRAPAETSSHHGQTVYIRPRDSGSESEVSDHLAKPQLALRSDPDPLNRKFTGIVRHSLGDHHEPSAGSVRTRNTAATRGHLYHCRQSIPVDATARPEGPIGEC